MSSYTPEQLVKRRAFSKAWHARHREEQNARSAKWHLNNRDYAIRTMRHRSLSVKRTVMNAYGGKCVCCQETRIEFLTIDHINRDGHRERNLKGGLYGWLIKNQFPKDRYRCLCMNCQFGFKNNSICPHQAVAEQMGGNKE